MNDRQYLIILDYSIGMVFVKALSKEDDEYIDKNDVESFLDKIGLHASEVSYMISNEFRLRTI